MSFWHYSIFGLNLRSNGPIPGPVDGSVDDPIDVQVMFRAFPAWWERAAGLPRHPWFLNKELGENGRPILLVERFEWQATSFFHLQYYDDSEFLIDESGSCVWIRWPDMYSLEYVTAYLLGPVLGFVLRLRDTLCLHASAVVIDDQAVVLVGQAGAGKSTTAAAFARRGHRVLTDDISALRPSVDGFLVEPAYPCIRLWSDSVAALFGADDALPLLAPDWDKRFLDVRQAMDRFQETAVPLAAIYFLGARCRKSAIPGVEAVAARRGLMQLVSETYINYLLDASQRAAEFECLARVVAEVPLRQLTPLADPARVDELCDLIVSDFRNLARPALIACPGPGA